MTWGADLEYLEKINKSLLQPDLAILLHGKRFLSAIEKKHRNENNSEKINISKNFHRLIADKYNWKLVNCNQKIDKVTKDIKKQIKIIDK